MGFAGRLRIGVNCLGTCAFSSARYAILGLDGEENGPTKLLYAKLYNPWGKLGRTKYDEDDKFGIDPTNPISYVRLDDLADACSKIRYANGPFPA